MHTRVRIFDKGQGWWNEDSKTTRRVSEGDLGKTSGQGAPVDNEAWWCNENTQEAFKEKKRVKKKQELSKNQDDR